MRNSFPAPWKGFSNKKTRFPFEVIVRDDCSTDETPRLILEYERQYPNLFAAYSGAGEHLLKRDTARA